MRLKLELEYTLYCSPKVLFQWLCTPEGLEEWFADKVTVEKDLFTFTWDKTESKARLSALKDNKFVRFEWLGKEDPESNFFEFRIEVQELTSDLALIITDFADPEEKEDAIFLWDTQIGDLKRMLGI
jgi:uncharacterized protein YndB with AHSA1/START domain